MLLAFVSLLGFSPPHIALTRARHAMGRSSSPTNVLASYADIWPILEATPATRDGDAKQQLLDIVARTGKAGVGASEERRAEIESSIRALEPKCPPNPARSPLSGTIYDLTYSTAPDGPNGKLGPLIGAVTQEFEDDRTFYNVVTLGALRIALRAEREIIDDERIRVTFLETSVSLFGRTVLRRPSNAGGVWVQRYVDEDLRVFNVPAVMNAARLNQGMVDQPATFILRKRSTTPSPHMATDEARRAWVRAAIRIDTWINTSLR